MHSDLFNDPRIQEKYRTFLLHMAGLFEHMLLLDYGVLKGDISIHVREETEVEYLILWKEDVPEGDKEKALRFTFSFYPNDIDPEKIDPIQTLIEMRGGFVAQNDGKNLTPVRNQNKIRVKFNSDSSIQWRKNPTLNLFFLKQVELELNAKLRARGFVFVNEALDSLGIRRTYRGQTLGWIRKSSEDPGHITLGITETRNKKFVEGEKADADLVFNTDGVIVHLIESDFS